MRKFGTRATRRAAAPGMSRGEKLKLLVMCAGVLLLGYAFWSVWRTANEARADRSDAVPEDVEPPVHTLALPEIDRELLDELARDATPEERVLLDWEAIDEAVRIARRLTPRHFEALGATELDAALAEEIASDPSAHRGRPLVLRGTVRTAERATRGEDGHVEHWGELVLSDAETVAHYRVLDAPGGELREGDFVRIDGLFVKLFRDEGPAGWVEGPLVVGPTAQPSYAPFGPAGDIAPESMFAGVSDDEARDGVGGLPEFEKWLMLAWARDQPEDAIDWESAPELDSELLAAILEHPREWRARPVRIPISRLLGFTVRRPGENPARLARVTEGWIGNWTWTAGHGVLHFLAPFAATELDEGDDLVKARGFFFKRWAYAPREGGVAEAPVFVLRSIERHVVPEESVLRNLLYAVGVASVLLVGILWFLVRRDRKRSAALQEALVRRRRARRARPAAEA